MKPSEVRQLQLEKWDSEYSGTQDDTPIPIKPLPMPEPEPDPLSPELRAFMNRMKEKQELTRKFLQD